MRKLILRNFQSPGDILMLTAAVRDLHRCHPGEFLTDVRTSCPELWHHNPHLTPLSEDDLVHIMTEPRNSLVRQYQKFFEMENAHLEFTPESLREIARVAKEKDTGARGLRSVIEHVMFDIMYELPEQEAGKKYVVTPAVVRGEEKLFLHDGSRAA